MHIKKILRLKVILKIKIKSSEPNKQNNIL